MSAPPIGSTTINPSTAANTSTPTIHHCDVGPVGSIALTPIATANATAPISSTALSGCCSLPMPIGRPGSVSCSFRNAITEPQNEIDPMTAANNDAITMCTVGDSPCWKAVNPSESKNSAYAISATVPPPTPLNNATNCGIAVIFVRNAGGTPSTTPITRPATISTQLEVSRIEIRVATTATPMPTAAIWLPRTAVFGPVRPIRP
ncbi:hypothetical protein MLGJGCBP_03954 [Rhodococcus sp. T7]|nr:hypothetical protein MLGJGCBP_03954 [Rhodococcus sp. T7]